MMKARLVRKLSNTQQNKRKLGTNTQSLLQWDDKNETTTTTALDRQQPEPVESLNEDMDGGVLKLLIIRTLVI